MRNIFDQYIQPENKLTHALVCTLNNNRSLLKPFLRWAGIRDVPPSGKLHITEQQVPGESVSGDESEESGLPDACVYDDDGWALLVEAKVQAGISYGQLCRHIATAERYGFEKPSLLLLSVDDPPKKIPNRTTHRAWRDVYAWFRKQATSSPPGRDSWANILTEYLELFESRMVAENYSIRGTITMFDGLKFDTDKPFTYREGKRLIRLLGDELQKRKDLKKIGVDPNGGRRSAITGRAGTAVWDFLPLKIARGANNFTAFPHLTMSLGQTAATAAITVPNGIHGGLRTKLKHVGDEGFLSLLMEIEKRLRPLLKQSKGAKAMIYATQRHYRSQRSIAEIDARLEADLRTILPGKQEKVKYQPEWTQAIYDVMTRKRSNIQLGVQVRLSYECPVVRSTSAVDLFSKSWIAMSPLLSFVLRD